MDFQLLQSCAPDLIEEMRSKGYAETYVNRHRTVIGQILNAAPDNNWVDFNDIWSWYQNTYQSKTYLHELRAVISNIEIFITRNQSNGNTILKSPLCNNRSAYSRLNKNYSALIDFYEELLFSCQLKETTRYSALHKSASFLLDLQEQNEDSLSKVTESGVLNCFNRDNKRIRGASCARVIKRMFTKCNEFDSHCLRIAAFIPLFRNERKNIQYLTESEIINLKHTIKDTSNNLSYKDRAIGILLLYTGLRGCDIAHMTLDEIIWDKDVIRISQKKTGQMIELPLIPIVGNAIYDYCKDERPNSASPYLFLSDMAPHDRLTTDGIGTAVQRLMAASHIRQNPGDRKGTHIFRHQLVKSMLQSEIATPVISSALGHTSPASLEAYLNTDIEHLRTCSLPISAFQVTEGVFSYD